MSRVHGARSRKRIRMASTACLDDEAKEIADDICEREACMDGDSEPSDGEDLLSTSSSGGGDDDDDYDDDDEYKRNSSDDEDDVDEVIVYSQENQ